MKFLSNNTLIHMIKRIILPALLIAFITICGKVMAQNEKVVDEIVALVEGFSSTDKEQKIIWRKTFPILPKESFESKDKTDSLKSEGLEFLNLLVIYSDGDNDVNNANLATCL